MPLPLPKCLHYLHIRRTRSYTPCATVLLNSKRGVFVSLFRRLGVYAMFVFVAGCVTEPVSQEPRVITPTNVPQPVPPAPSAVPPKSGGEPRLLSPLAAPTSGGVGYYQSRQEQQLRERLDGTGIRVSRAGDSILLTLPGNSAFALNGDQLQPRFVDWLTTVAMVLREYSKTAIEVKGYTDSTGSFEHNQDLSTRRAQTVGSLLIGRQVTAARIRTVGFGPRYPVADNKSDAGRAQNRRVEIVLVPTP
jgi:outer membrane protein OmpA-like peptidoglycan-associated protein